MEIMEGGNHLRVSKCHYESGRKRHLVPRSITIPFEDTFNARPPSDWGSDNASVHGSDTDSDDTNVNINVQTGLGTAPGLLQDTVQFFDEEEAIEIFNDVDMSDDDDDDDDDDDEEEENINENDNTETTAGGAVDLGAFSLPQISRWRLNVTALSQVYNLYFVAYKNQIHVSRTRSCVTNALPAFPDLLLKPRASSMSYRVGGGIDPDFPHQVNHLIVGDLGAEEIVLLAFDDGDVIAYYTKSIEDALVQREREEGSRTMKPVEPFFHENVGKSAWGLAIHKKSRLIAVGTNNHNVAVFIFALAGIPYYHIPNADPVELFRNLVKDHQGNIINPSGSSWATLPKGERAAKAAAMESLVRQRDANWRIVLETGPMGGNIPNVAFTNNANGEADKVAATDVNGNLWLMDIWRFDEECPHIRIGQIHQNQSTAVLRRFFRPHNSKPRGWGVLILPESSFLPTTDFDESFGLPDSCTIYITNERIGQWIDISEGRRFIKDNSLEHPWKRSGQSWRFMSNPADPGPAERQNWFGRPEATLRPRLSTGGTQELDGPVMLPHTQQHASCKVAVGKLPREPREQRQRRPKTVLPDGSSILRTYEMDIELRSFEEGGVGVMFANATLQERPAQAVLPRIGWSHERLSNLLHVPELSLVVAGSMCGRVALVTLTRPKTEYSSLKRGFKVETILPTKSEEDKGLRPICPLLGVAVSPLFQAEEGAARPKRYRLMLHYYDLRILSYELSRDSTTDILSVFQ